MSVTTADTIHLARKAKARKQQYNLSNSEKGKDKRHDATMTRLIRMGKEDNKTKHKSERLSTTESTKAKVVKCTKCKQTGHPTRQCPVIKANSSRKKKAQIDWNILLPKPSTKKMKMYEAKIKW